jgi:N-acetylneuraminate synthase
MKKQTFIIGEIGINHNGDIDIARRLIDAAAQSGCNAVKFQKRTVEKVYTKSDLDRPRESPWGSTNREQKLGLEFTEGEYDIINEYCNSKNIEWFASAWDVDSQIFMRKYDLNYNKVASPLLTNRALLEEIASEDKHTFISTGMSSLEQIEKASSIFRKANCSFELMHCNSTYPLKEENINLSLIPRLAELFNVDVGYSGHETGITACVAAVALGATSIERHITLDRAMYGSDHAASLEITGLTQMIKHIRTVEKCMGSPVKVVHESELPCMAKLRTVDTL